MTREEVDRKKEIAAMALLEKSGVGPMYAKAKLTRIYLDMVNELSFAGSEDEAIVKVALQYAFSNIAGFTSFIFEESMRSPVNRYFRVVR